MSILGGIKERLKGKRPDNASYDNFAGLSLEDKCSLLYRQHRVEDRTPRINLNRLWFMTTLYYQGKQTARVNSVDGTIEIYEQDADADFYIENQFRKDAWGNVKSLNAGEQKPEVSPGSNNPEEIAQSRFANMALDLIYEDIEWSRLKTMKNLSLALYGNAFKFNSFATSSEFGVTLLPKYDYQSVELGGMDYCEGCAVTHPEGTGYCPQCMNPTQTMAGQSVEVPIANGYEERPHGRNVSFITTPLEMYCRSNVRGGLKYQPYLFWVRRMDRDIVLDARPDAEVGTVSAAIESRGSSTVSGDDLAQYYQDVLSNLAGGPYSGTYITTRQYQEVEYAMCWIRPEMFRGDAELKKKFPKGVHFETCNGQAIKGTLTDQSMDSCWTHYGYLPNPYSFWCDGLVDGLPVCDQINETNSLLVRYIRYCTNSKKLYDSQMIDPQTLSNNPEEAWIPVNTQLDKPIGQAVFPLAPTQISQDVGAWKQNMVKQALPDMTGMYPASMGEEGGANTPYSRTVFEAERSQGRFAPIHEFNQPSVVQDVRQMLEIFRENALDDRKFALIENSGEKTFEHFKGADLGTGSLNIRIPDGDTLPQSRTDKAKGAEMLVQLQPILPMLTQKQKVYVLDLIGFPADGNPDTLQIERAWRNIQKVKDGDTQVTPMLFVDDLAIQIPVVAQYLASEQGDQLGRENANAFANLYTLLTTMVQMQMMQQTAMAGHQDSMQPAASSQGSQSAGAGKAGASPSSPQASTPKPEMAQSPVGKSQQVPIQPLPAGARM